MRSILPFSSFVAKRFGFTFHALVALAGATGCNGVVQNDLPPTEPVPNTCSKGAHVEIVCAAAEGPACSGGEVGLQLPDDFCAPPPSTCVEQCVPDACPEGSVAREVCAAAAAVSVCPPGVVCDTVCLDDADCGDVAPPPEECHFECVPLPVDPCGEGFHSENVCVQVGDPDQACAPEEPCPPPPVECFDQCVPNSECPAGTYAETQCIDECTDDVCTHSCSLVCLEYGPDDARPSPPRP